MEMENNVTKISPIKTIRKADTDFETSVSTSPHRDPSRWQYILYLLAGIFFGILLVKSEVISWFRIQEMFRLESFHMYGVLGTAVMTGIVSVWLIKKLNLKTFTGEQIAFSKKAFHKGNIYGGLLFGFGWAFTGACPGPIFAQIGSGFTVVVVTLLSAIAGTWVYGYFRDRLPH
jgi:uncharacterized membrane protein YedE/YeeE